MDAIVLNVNLLKTLSMYIAGVEVSGESTEIRYRSSQLIHPKDTLNCD